MDYKGEISALLRKENLLRGFIAIFVFMLAGAALFILFFSLSGLTQKKSEAFFLLQNCGLFFFFISLMAGYAAVHRGNSLPDASSKVIILDIVKKSHVLLLVGLGAFLAVLIIALLQLLISLLGMIPYAGPVTVALLSLPFLAVNVVAVSGVIIVIIILPLLVAEGKDLRRCIADLKSLAARRWAWILFYSLASGVVLILMLSAVLFVIRYAGGITKAVQWNINAAYPKIFSFVSKSSYFTDIIGSIAPNPDPVSALRKYGTEVFDYLKILGWIIKISYAFGLAALLAMVLTLHFNLLSLLYSLIKGDVIDN